MLRMIQNATMAFSTSKAYYVTKGILAGISDYIESMVQYEKEYQ